MNNGIGKKDYSQYPLRPTGDTLSEYEGWKNWPNAQWAWEFLRRNPDYNKLCMEIESENLDPKERNKKLRKEFGLPEYKHCMEPFAENPPRFQTAKPFTRSWLRFRKENKFPRKIKLTLDRGQVFMRFDVRPGGSTAKSLDSQIEAAKEVLRGFEQRWLKRTNTLAAKDIRGTYFFISLLRLLDFVDYRDVTGTRKPTNSTIYRTLFPFTLKEERSGESALSLQQSKFDKKFQRAKIRAVGYTKKRGYLDLASTQGQPPAAIRWTPPNT